MSQISLSDMEYSCRKRITKRDEFLGIMEDIIPWDEWVEYIRPYYPDGKRGRPVIGIEKNKIGKKLFRAINYVLEQACCMMKGGTIVDATIINAPSSTKNAKGERDPEMHQTKKGNEWRFGMKCHIGVDAASGLVHTVTATAANAHDITEASKLIREDDEVVYGDSGYLGIEKREEIKNNEHLSNVEYRINRRPKKLPKVTDETIDWEKYIEHRKSSVRCKVEHVFRIIKGDFGYRKVVYRGIAKNLNRLNVMFACANLLMCARVKRSLQPLMG